jgi:hypothetical protein
MNIEPTAPLATNTLLRFKDDDRPAASPDGLYRVVKAMPISALTEAATRHGLRDGVNTNNVVREMIAEGYLERADHLTVSVRRSAGGSSPIVVIKPGS